MSRSPPVAATVPAAAIRMSESTASLTVALGDDEAGETRFENAYGSGVAQLVEQWPHSSTVESSSLSPATNKLET